MQIIVSIIFLVYFTLISSTFLRGFTEIVKTSFFSETSIMTILFWFTIVLYIVSLFKTNSIIKTNVIIVPLAMLAFLIVFIATIRDFTPQRIFPILGYGSKQTFLKGSTNIFAFSGLAYLYFFMPHIKSNKKATRLGIISCIISSLMLISSIASLVMAFPFVTSTEELSSTLFAIRTISFGDFFDHPESVFLLIGLLSLLSYLSVTMIVISSICNKIFKNHDLDIIRKFYLPIIFVLALLPKKIYQIRFIDYNVYKYFSLVTVYIIPLILLILATLKKKNWKGET